MTTYSNIRYAAAGVTEYATADDLPTTAASGSQAFVAGTNRLYIWNGTGWYNIALINTNPTISGVSSSYTLAQDGTATTVTITASDPEGIPITYSLASDTSGNAATVVQGTGASTNVFTITPSTSEANAGTFTLTFRASDGVNIATAPAEFSLAFQVANSHYTSALITSVGANNAVNNTFIDSSSNSHAITASGNAHQTTFSPYRHGGYSLHFPGAVRMDLGFSTLNSGDWTFECWAKIEVGDMLLGKYNGGNQLEAFGVSPTTGYMYSHTGAGVETPTCNNDLRDGNWHYLVWERYNGTYYYWADGSLETSFANTETPAGGGNWSLGGWSAGQFTGNIKEARLSLTTAVYTGSAPTTPTEPQTTAKSTDAFFTGVGLEVKDYSSNNRTFTPPATLEVQPTAPYDYNQYSSAVNGGSLHFDGSGDYLKTASSSTFNLYNTAFTIEGWFYATAPDTGEHLLSSYINSSNRESLYFSNSTTLSWWVNGSIRISATVAANEWYHVAIVDNVGTTTMYIDGTSQGTWASTYTDGNRLVWVGTYNDGAYAPDSFTGYISDWRIVKGTAVYTSAFTPPTTPLTAITNTSLLLKGTNAGIIDKSQSVKAVTLNGNVSSSTTQTKYLSSSMYFDGTGDYIEVADTLGEFTNYSNATLEMWVYPTTSSGEKNLIEKFTPASGPGWTLYTPTNSLNLQWYGGGTTNSSTAMTINQWNHVAVVHYNGTRKIYVNGTGGTGVSFTSTVSTNPLRVGVRGTTGNFFTGYMSDIRIQLGLAVYTADFTPPTAALKG